MAKFQHPNHPIRCIKTGPSECGKSVFLTNTNFKIHNEFEKTYISSSSLHQDWYQTKLQCFNNKIPLHIVPNFLEEENVCIVIEEKVNDENFEKSDCEIDTYESIKELEYTQDNDIGRIIILDDLNEKKLKDPRVQATFKRTRHNNLSIFVISQAYYELPKRTIWTNGTSIT